MCDDVQLCNHCVREFLILARTWFAFGLPSKTECDSERENFGVKVTCCLPLADISACRGHFAWEQQTFCGLIIPDYLH
jgi:hypothetical protein